MQKYLIILGQGMLTPTGLTGRACAGLRWRGAGQYWRENPAGCRATIRLRYPSRSSQDSLLIMPTSPCSLPVSYLSIFSSFQDFPGTHQQPVPWLFICFDRVFPTPPATPRLLLCPSGPSRGSSNPASEVPTATADCPTRALSPSRSLHLQWIDSTPFPIPENLGCRLSESFHDAGLGLDCRWCLSHGHSCADPPASESRCCAPYFRLSCPSPRFSTSKHPLMRGDSLS
jgi:hypothetical protein